MSRIIDADALPDALFQKHVHYGEGIEMYLSYNDVVNVIDAAPTIDAIPVEWLFGLIDAFVTTGDANMQEYALLLSNIIETWQKEQEAR